jgi:hypothetical protein
VDQQTEAGDMIEVRVVVDETAPPGNLLVPLARLLRTLRDREQQSGAVRKGGRHGSTET